MINLKNKYVIGTHIMFFEIEMYRDFILSGRKEFSFVDVID